MTKSWLKNRILGIVCLLPLTSCALISQSGPTGSQIRNDKNDFIVVNVESRADIPTSGRVYGLAEVPKPVKGQGYSDDVRSRDTLEVIITDVGEQSPFAHDSKYGPFQIPEDGIVSIPYVGEIQVIGRSLSEISKELEEKIRPVSNTARPSVHRTGRIPSTANVIGEVEKPGPVPLERERLDSVDLLAAAGGPKDNDYLFKYKLRRGNRDYNFDHVGFFKHPFIVEEGDLLTVSTDTTNRFHVMGAINKPTSIPFPLPDPTLADAMGASVGLDERRSDPTGVFVFRKGDPDIVYTFNFKNPAVMPIVQRFPIQGGDIVFVTEAPLVRWNRLITQILPSTFYQIANTSYRYGR